MSASDDFAARRMDASVRQALAGHSVDDISVDKKAQIKKRR
ncbi:MAG: hypothetical protein ACI9CE_003717 [Flavobacterium sp.]|jgi:hypothetical protein